jgi:broad specificity phosphatase PhoE
MQKVYFLRHGESTSNIANTCAGHTDVGLTDFGRAQAKSAGKEILESGIDFDIIISSPLIRALDTAKIVANTIGYPENQIIDTDLLKERFRGDYEGQPSTLQHGKTNSQLIEHGAESEKEMIDRIKKLFKYIKSLDADNILLVSHNQLGRQTTAYLTDKKFDEVEKLPNVHLFELPIDRN